MSLTSPNRRRFGRRSFLTGIGAATLGGTLLSACGAPSTGNDGGGGGSSEGFKQPAGDVPSEYADRLRVVVWSGLADSRAVAFQSLVDKFNEAQSEIFVEHQFQGDVMQKITAGIRANEVADLLYVGVSHFTSLYLSDQLEPFDGYFGNGLAKEDYNEVFIEEGTVRGETYWLPFARSTALMYYNKTVFEQSGLGDQAPTTWAEMREWGDAVKGINYKGNPVTFQGYSDQDNDWQFQGMLWQWGTGISDGFDITIDSAPAIEVAEFTRALVHDDGNAYMANEIVADFTNGLVATAVMSTASLRGLRETVDFELGAAFVPEHHDTGVALGGGGWSLLKNVPQERKDAAFEFVSWLATPEVAAEWTTLTGYMVTTAAAAETDAYKQAVADDPYFSLALEQLPRARKFDDARFWIDQVATTNFESLSKIWADNADPAVELPALADKLRALVDENMAVIEDRVL